MVGRVCPQRAICRWLSPQGAEDKRAREFKASRKCSGEVPPEAPLEGQCGKLET
jgi:hypothetical protein